MNILIRQACAEDIDTMVWFLGQLFTIESDFVVDAEKQRAGLARLLDTRGATILVAEREGELAGMCTVQVLVSTAEGAEVGVLEDVFVAPRHRRQGVGRLLVRRAQELARTMGLRRLQLLADRTNTSAIEFYERLGWRHTKLIALRSFMH